MIQYDIKEGTEFQKSIKTEWNTEAIFNPEFMHDKMNYCSMDTVYGMFENHRHFIFAFEGDTIVGVLKIKIGGNHSLRQPNLCNWVDYITVDPKYKGKGIASNLIKMMFEYLKEKNESHMLASGYSADGYNYLRPKLRKLAEEYGIEYVDRDMIEF